jgi:ParB-like chromosome segregation protein Spo0J
MAEDSAPTDLLGDPLRPLPDKRGRRKLRFAEEVYEKVEVLAAGNLTQDEIADAVGISAPSLRKYFRPELGKGLARQKAEALSLLAAAARKGNVTAIKAWNAELDKQRAAESVAGRARGPGANVVRLGKKEERKEAAGKVASGGKFAPPPAPRLAIDNA